MNVCYEKDFREICSDLNFICLFKFEYKIISPHPNFVIQNKANHQARETDKEE